MSVEIGGAVARRALSVLLITSLIALHFAGCSAAGARHIETVDSGGPPKGDWSRVARLARASTIKVTLNGGKPTSRNFVAAGESELVVLNLTDATLPRQVRRTLRSLASDRPKDLFRVSHGQALTEGHVRLGPDGVFLDGRKVAALEQVVELSARSNVAEISLVHSATRRGIGWGALIGAGVGLAITLTACGTNWSQESGSCTNLTGLWLFAGPFYGGLIGAAAGAGSRVSTVVYREP